MYQDFHSHIFVLGHSFSVDMPEIEITKQLFLILFSCIMIVHNSDQLEYFIKLSNRTYNKNYPQRLDLLENPLTFFYEGISYIVFTILVNCKKCPFHIILNILWG